MASLSQNSSTSYIDRCPDRDAYLVSGNRVVHYFSCCFSFKYFHKLLDVCCDTSQRDDVLATQLYLFKDLNFFAKFVPSVWPNEASFLDACHHFTQLCYKIGCQVVDFEQTIHDLPVIIMEC